MRNKSLPLLVAASAITSLLYLAPAARADVVVAPVTTNVAVSGTTVTATITPDVLTSIDAAEFFVGVVGADGTGWSMSLSGSSGAVTATGTLPEGLTLGASYTVSVHGLDLVGQWGAVASTGFVLGSTTVSMPLGDATVSVSESGTYAVALWPIDPCLPQDPCKTFSKFGSVSSPQWSDFPPTPVDVAAGTIYIRTRVTRPPNPCAPTDPCRNRSFLVSLVATDGLRYKASTSDLLATFVPR